MIGNPASKGNRGRAQIRTLGDQFVDDAQAVRLLGRHAVAAEPSAAAAVAALLTARADGWLSAGESVVAVVTGTALKQPGALQRIAPPALGTVEADAAQWNAVLADVAVCP